MSSVRDLQNHPQNSTGLLEFFILTQKLSQEWVMPLNSQETKQIFFACYHFDWNNSALLKAMKMNQTYLWGKNSTVSGVIKIFHFSCLIQSTCHSPLKLRLLHEAPTSLREKVLFMKSNKIICHFLPGVTVFDGINCCLELWIPSNAISFLLEKNALSLTFKITFTLNTYFKTG